MAQIISTLAGALCDNWRSVVITSVPSRMKLHFQLRPLSGVLPAGRTQYCLTTGEETHGERQQDCDRTIFL